MKKFLQAAFRITLFQIFIVLFFSGLKYVLTTYKLEDKIQRPFIWTCIGAGVLFVLAVGITGLIENRSGSYEKWQTKPQKSGGEKILAACITWGIAIPTGLAYVLFLYVIAPTSLSLLIALYGGIVIRNSIRFFSKEQTSLKKEIN